MSQEMEKMVVFQFTIIDEGHTFQSSYDLVLNGISSEDDDYLEMAKKPCVGVRVMDFHAGVVHLWSLEKLHTRVRQMRQIYQYLDRPEYLQVPILHSFISKCLRLTLLRRGSTSDWAILLPSQSCRNIHLLETWTSL